MSWAAAGRSGARWLRPLLLVLAVRLMTLGAYPLADTSEARYGEIARVMRETGNWVTPQETAGTPFWAKPPLYAWLGAASTVLFGVDEFALRLPSFLCGCAALLLCFVWAESLARRLSPSPPSPLPQAGEGSPGLSLQQQGEEHAVPSPLSHASGRGAGGEGEQAAALLACLVLATTTLFFIGYGAVMTDPALGLCTAWMMVAFQRAVIDGSPHPLWRYGFFAAAGLAMLAKGPVAFLYVGLPVAVWATWRGRWRATWQGLPWIGGTLLFAAIGLPWYALAEARTPGFVNYFLLGEHVMRFLHPGWSGDLYGNAHSEPVGTIWAYLAAALGLWSIALVALVRPAHGWLARARAACQDEARLFALLTVLLPLLVLTFARNLIWTYVMPTLVPLAALLGVELARRSARPGPWRAGVMWLARLSVSLLCIGAIVWAPLRANGSSFARPVSAWRQHALTQPGALLYWGRRAPASLRFYSRGAAQTAPDLAARLAQLAPGARAYVAIVPEQLPALRELASAQSPPLELTVVGQVKHAAIVEAARPRA